MVDFSKRLKLAEEIANKLSIDSIDYSFLGHNPLPLKGVKYYWKKFFEICSEKNINVPIDFYTHIPFCKSRCKYCLLFSSADLSQEKYDCYYEYISDYLDYFKDIFKDVKFRHFFVGGGSPNALPNSILYKILKKQHYVYDFRYSNVERAIEINPSIFNIEFLDIVNQFNFNRISMGVQSFLDETISEQNRGYVDLECVKDIYSNIKTKTSVQEVNLDFIIGLPDEDEKIIMDSINKAISLGVETITIYTLHQSMDNSLFFITGLDIQRLKNLYDSIASSVSHVYDFKDASPKHYPYPTCVVLTKKGHNNIHKYNVSNTLKRSIFSLGPSSQGIIYGILNYKHSSKFFESFSDSEILDAKRVSKNDKQFIYISSSLFDGKILKDDFYQKFSVEFSERYPNEVSYLINEGLLVEDKNSYIWNNPDIQKSLTFSLLFLDENALTNILNQNWPT